jgi:hypothetical protein
MPATDSLHDYIDHHKKGISVCFLSGQGDSIIEGPVDQLGSDYVVMKDHGVIRVIPFSAIAWITPS